MNFVSVLRNPIVKKHPSSPFSPYASQNQLEEFILEKTKSAITVATTDSQSKSPHYWSGMNLNNDKA